MDMKLRKKLILNGNIYKVIITLSIPIMINNLIQTLYNVIDGIWVSKIGSVPFAATSFVWPVEYLFISIGTGISIAGTSILSQLIGAEKPKETNKYSAQLIVLSFISSIIFAAIGFIITPMIVKLMGGTGELAYYSDIYLRITFLGMPFTFYYFTFNSIMVAQGNTLLPTLLSGMSAILNAILDPIFIFILHMGMAGAPTATLICKLILAVAGFIILKRTKGIIKPDFREFRFDKEKVKEIIKIALPSSLGQSGSALGFIFLNVFIASYGTAIIAAFGMVNRITSVISQPAMGIGAALVTIVGQNLGSNQKERVKEAFNKASIFTVAISVIGSLALYINDTSVIDFFMQSKDDMQVINEGIIYLQYILYSMPLMGMFSVFQGIFQGSGHTKYSMNMEIGRLWLIRLPMILIFKHFTNIGPVGIWFSMSFSNLLICVYAYVIYRTNKWQASVI